MAAITKLRGPNHEFVCAKPGSGIYRWGSRGDECTDNGARCPMHEFDALIVQHWIKIYRAQVSCMRANWQRAWASPEFRSRRKRNYRPRPACGVDGCRYTFTNSGESVEPCVGKSARSGGELRRIHGAFDAERKRCRKLPYFCQLNLIIACEDDRLALVDGLADGTIDIVVSGHNPQDAEAVNDSHSRKPLHGGRGNTVVSIVELHHAHGLHRNAHPRDRPSGPPLDIDGGIAGRCRFCAGGFGSAVDCRCRRAQIKIKNAAIEGRKLQGRLKPVL